MHSSFGFSIAFPYRVVLNPAMQTLGITDKPQKPDNWFQRICWPSDSPSEIVDLGRRGFWMCFIVALFSTVVLLVQGHWLVAPLVLAVYWLGGMGVREHSFQASMVIFFVYLVDTLATLVVLHRPPGALGVIILLVLAGNIRGTWIASKWSSKDGEPDDPYASAPGFRENLVDLMPARVWPTGKFVFLALASLYMALNLFGSAVLLFRGALR
jgi:hypothetical protein